MVYIRTKIALLASLVLLPLFISAVPQNYTVDDSDQGINYWTDADWSHDPLAGYERYFLEGTRSFTYVPGGAALFNFTGTGIYLQGPHSNDQAFRSVTLDGQNMGIFSAYAPQRLPTEGSSSVFWGQGGLPNILHTVVVTHVDTADKILVMDAWIYEADPSQLPRSTGTNTADAAVSTSGSDSDTTAGIIIGISVPVLLLPLCIAGYCLFSRRLERNAKRQHDTMKERLYSFRNPAHLSQPPHSASTSAALRSIPSHWLSANATSAPEDSSSNLNAELAPAGAAVPRGDGGGEIPSLPLHDRPRAASDACTNEGTLGLSDHPLFTLAPLTSRFSDSSDSHYPTSPPYAGAPMLFFKQRPDPIPPLNSDYAPQPIVNAPPTSPSVFRRLSASIAGVIPARPARSPLRNSNAGKRRASVLTQFRYTTASTTSPGFNSNLRLDVGRAASPQIREQERDVYPPYTPPPHLPSSPSYTSIPLTAISAVSTGSGRKSANLEDLKYETSNRSRTDSPHTLNTGVTTPHRDGFGAGELTAEREMKSKRGSKADPFASDEGPGFAL